MMIRDIWDVESALEHKKLQLPSKSGISLTYLIIQDMHQVSSS